MKRTLCLAAFLALAAQLPVWAYDSSPSFLQIVPEVIWAQATGGGTWVTEIQITSFETTSDIVVYFDYNGGSTGGFVLSPSLPIFCSLKSSNILAKIDGLDPGPLDYFGHVGAVWFHTVTGKIQVQAKTVNGNFGKTFPGLNLAEGNTAAQGRPLIIQDLVQNSTYRTFAGAYNPNGTTTYTVQFAVIDQFENYVGAPFYKTLPPLAFITFNPFKEAGVASGTYDNCWLEIKVMAGGSGPQGIMCFGSTANNYTNDTYPLVAKMYY
jgi:hypothetical protein